MAIGPRELNLTLFGEEKAFVDALERQIDEYLKKHWGGGSCSINCQIYRQGIRTSAVKQELKRRFTAAGWRDVIFHNDQRDGDFVELQE